MITVNRVVSALFSIQQDLCLISANHHNISFTHKFFSIVSLWYFIISIIRGHKLNFMNVLENIMGNILVSELFLIRMIKYFSCVHHHNKYSTRIFLHCLIYIYFAYRLLVVISFTVWLTFEKIKINRVVSEWVFIQQRQFFQSVQNHNKSFSHDIFLTNVSFILFSNFDY